MWIIAHYLPVSLFSLKPASATSSGGKTLLIPTPYALKMALLTAALRRYGLSGGEELFPRLRDLQVYLDPPAEMVVVKSFSKIRREIKDKNDLEKAQRAREKKEYPLQSTIAYRDYVSYKGRFRLACQLTNADPLVSILPDLLLQINYLGKRGGFLQMLGQPETRAALPDDQFIHLTGEGWQDFETNRTLQMLDDCGPSLTFAKANIYDTAKIVLHKDRVLRHIILPYQQIHSSRSYSWYQHIHVENT